MLGPADVLSSSSRGRLLSNCQFFLERDTLGLRLPARSFISMRYEKSWPSGVTPIVRLLLFWSSSLRIFLLNCVEIFRSIYLRRGRAPYNGSYDSFRAKSIAGWVTIISMLRSFKRVAKSLICILMMDLYKLEELDASERTLSRPS